MLIYNDGCQKTKIYEIKQDNLNIPGCVLCKVQWLNTNETVWVRYLLNKISKE